MLKIEKSVTIDAPVEDVYAYAIDPEHLPEYFVSILAVKDVKRLPAGEYTFTYTAQTFGVPAEGKGECVGHVPNERAILKLHMPGVDMTIPTTFERVPGGKTRVIGTAEYTFQAGGFASKFDEAFLMKYLDLAGELSMYTLKGRIELGIPAAAR